MEECLFSSEKKIGMAFFTHCIIKRTAEVTNQISNMYTVMVYIYNIYSSI